MKYIITLIIFFFSLNINASFFPDKKEYENVLKKNFEHEEQKISYFIYYPNPKKNIKKEIYIIFHGETSKAEDFLNKTRLYTNIKNENAAFIAFNSSASDWYSHTRKNIKDKDFIIKLLNRIEKTGFNKFNIIGYSSGGSFVNELICEGSIPAKMNNILTINSSGKKEWIENCKIPNNLNYNSILSEKDDYYTYDGTIKRNNKYKIPEESFINMSEYFNLFRIKMNCSNESVTTSIEKDISDNSYIEHNVYRCSNKNRNNMELFKGIEMGHNLPNVIDYSLEDFRGNTNFDIRIIDIFN